MLKNEKGARQGVWYQRVLLRLARTCGSLFDYPSYVCEANTSNLLGLGKKDDVG